MKPALAEGRVSGATLAGFAAGSVGTGLFSTVPTVLLLFYCTETLGIAASVASAILFLPKLWCLYWDPLVGRWSDRIWTHWGRRAPFMFAGALGTAGGFLLLFHAPAGYGAATVGFVGIAYFLATTCYTLFSVPYITVPAEISSRPLERERAVAWRMPCLLLGVLVGAGATPHLVALGGGGRSGYSAMSWAVAAVSLVAMLAATNSVRSLVGNSPSSSSTKPSSRLPTGPSPYRYRPFRWLVLAYVMQMAAVAYVIAVAPYLVTQVLHAPPETSGTMLGILLGTGILTIPVWFMVARKFGTQRSLTGASLLLIIALAGMLFLREGMSDILVMAEFAALGAPFAALQLLPLIELAHLTNKFGVEHGIHCEATFTGLFIAAEKIALASGSMLVGLGLAALGHIGGGALDGSSVGKQILQFAVVVPGLLCAGSLLVGRLQMDSSRSQTA